VIQKVGNQAVHNRRPIRQYDALQVVKELHHLCHWLVCTYTPAAGQENPVWSDDRVPPAPESGVPTDAYELEQAVADGFLVPPRVQQVDPKFPREGIVYDKLSDEEKSQWESLDWGDDVEPGSLPDRVNAAAINSWLFNKDTVDRVLQHLMQHGHKVDGGDRLAKTIIFARNHEHARFIEERFNHHYPRHHLRHIVIHRLRTNQPLTADDLTSLERTLVEIGEDDGETLLSALSARSEAPSLAHFVRSLVGMDRSAAQAAFSQFLNDRSLKSFEPQVHSLAG
jgi:type I site-specific restriction endonuclease